MKSMYLDEAELLDERSKMVTELVLDSLMEKHLECQDINVPMYRVFDLVKKPKREEEMPRALRS
jgi:hypothetical protein